MFSFTDAGSAFIDQVLSFERLQKETHVKDRNEEINIPGPVGNIRCKIYSPVKGKQSLPILVYFHGGGCCLMSPEDFEGTNTVIAEEAECIVVVPQYRLAPENPFPAPLEDCYATLRWVQMQRLVPAAWSVVSIT